MARQLRRDINVTPLVDIVLVLLIVFIIVTPAVDSSVNLPVAKHAAKGAAAEGPKISLRREGRFARAMLEVKGSPARSYKIGESLDAASLSADLLRFGAGHPYWEVVVKADAALPNALVGELLKACRAGGASRAVLITGEDAAALSRKS